MGEHTEIAWCDATFNAWWGCTKVSPACDLCYAERMAHRLGLDIWGLGKPRREFGPKHWNQPLRWARILPARYGRRPRVFSGSMCDVFDNDAPSGAREQLWSLIERTPEMDWLLLTKRIGNAARMIPRQWFHEGFPANVWLGATVVTQDEIARDVPKLMALPVNIKFLSVEPMIERLSIYAGMLRLVSWVICGGESGPGARPMEQEWARFLRAQCSLARVPFFMKQGSQANWPAFRDFESFPDELRVREFPL